MSTDNWVRDQLEIRQLIENYFDAANRRNSDALMTLWADDCRWSVPDIPGLEDVRGKAAIKENFESAQKLFPVAFVVGMVGDIRIDGDSATARVYTTEVLETNEGSTRNAVGVYEDILQRIDGSWYFSERVWRITYQQ